MIRLEKDSDLNKIVVPIEIAKELKRLGVPQNSIFAYFDNNDFMCSAYTFEEITDFIPDMIGLTEETYIARFDGYDKITPEQLDSGVAEVSYQRADQVGETPFMAVCRYKGSMVAFSKTDEGSYNNLIRWGHNQAEATALMLIALIEEGKILFKD
ncbi:hypothetical protein FACS189441_8310 [Betaproteobacteria bacterium]|nr:hypothetical protein FACS189441_8310 [Betaproteobacteria bacterium]